ncbi:Ankyrin-1 [Armadillidium vulgare]|nr:Ankyrin-1 [Armadillidium vulgare]
MLLSFSPRSRGRGSRRRRTRGTVSGGGFLTGKRIIPSFTPSSDEHSERIGRCHCPLSTFGKIKVLFDLELILISCNSGLSPLHYAVWQRYLSSRISLEEGCDANALDDIGYSPLHLAAEHGFLNLIELLLKHEAQVNFNDPNPIEPYPMAVVDEPLRLAVKNDHYDAAKMLLEHGANPNSCYFFGYEINLINPFNSEMMNLLLSYGANPNARDRQSLSPIMKACRLHQGSSEELERQDLISGREILLHFAEMLKGMETVLLLISFGADVNIRTDARHDYSFNKYKDRTVLHYAVLSGSVPIVNLLIKQGAKINFEAEYQRPTPLDLAILKGDVPMIKLLIEQDVNVNSSSPVIGSPLHVACTDGIKNRYEVIDLLLKAGADPNQIIYDENNKPLRTILGEYLSSNEEHDVDIINLFLRYGAEVVMQSQNHHTKGILNDISNLYSNPKALITLLEAAHSFDLPIIRQSSLIDEKQRQIYLKIGDSPLSLKHLVRVFLRRHDTLRMPDKIVDLEIPKILKRYLLYKINICN